MYRVCTAATAGAEGSRLVRSLAADSMVMVIVVVSRQSMGHGWARYWGGGGRKAENDLAPG